MDKYNVKINILDIYEIIKKTKKILLSIVFLIVLIVGISTIFIKPVYETTESVVVKNTQFFNQCVNIAKDDSIYQNTISDVKAQINNDKITSSIEINPVLYTKVINIVVKSSDDETAYKVADGYLNNLLDATNKNIPKATIKVLSTAKAPYEVMKSRRIINIMMAFGLGIIISSIIILIAGYQKSRSIVI